VPRICEFYPGICLTTEEKSLKNLSQVKKNLNQSTVYILPKYPHIKPPPPHTHTHTHTFQNNIKPPQYKLKQNAHRKSKTMGRKNSTYFLLLLIHRYSTPFLTGTSLHFTALHFTSPTINTFHFTPRFNLLHLYM
jgi:hypothetical protein